MEYILSFLPENFKNLPTHMDFDGQRRAERHYQFIILVCGAIGFIYGYVNQSMSSVIAWVTIGFLISSGLVLFPWGIYRRQPLKWQPARDEDGNPVSRTDSAGKGKQLQKKKLKQ